MNIIIIAVSPTQWVGVVFVSLLNLTHMQTIKYHIEITVNIVAENQYGKMFQTSEGWHINGNKKKFIQNIIKDVHSDDLVAKQAAQYVLFLMNNFEEI